MIKQITVTGRIILNKYKKLSLVYVEDLLQFISNLNFSITPLNIIKKINFNLLRKSRGLIISGGGDIHKVSKNKIDKVRDNIELKLYNFFKKKNKPILAICRGHQLLINFNGGTLKIIKNHVKKNHDLKISNSRFLKTRKINVNSFHKYGTLNNLDGFNKVGFHKDGTIEIHEHKTKKILCFMFHPERQMKSKKEVFRDIIKFFK